MIGNMKTLSHCKTKRAPLQKIMTHAWMKTFMMRMPPMESPSPAFSVRILVLAQIYQSQMQNLIWSSSSSQFKIFTFSHRNSSINGLF